ncbi:Lectizyme [Gryllus bimaculatus]|nr:Lectizyme [Gryllus bimaculatus]
MICIVGIILFAGAVCGADLEPNFANGRIVGGSNTDIKFHPYQVSVQRNGRHFCGGSIIHANYILTAAHCTGYSGTYSVRAGTSLNGRGGLEVGVAEEEGAAPLVLQEVELPLLDNAACKKYYPLRITSRMVCAGYAEGGRDACQTWNQNFFAMIRAVVVLLLVSAVYGSESGTQFSNGRIVGGRDTNIKFYPFQVSLQLNGSHWCGGSVISANYILTAAHCMGYDV